MSKPKQLSCPPSPAVREALLWEALESCQGVDLYVITLIRWVFNLADRDQVGNSITLTKSQLASKRWLCCSVSNVKSVLRRANLLHFVRVQHQQHISGGSEINSYGIDWPAVFAHLGKPYPQWAKV